MAAGPATEELPELELAADPYEAAAGAHCLVLCTEWPEYRDLDPTRLRDAMVYQVIVDGRNLFDGDAMRTAGITYYPVGRAPTA